MRPWKAIAHHDETVAMSPTNAAVSVVDDSLLPWLRLVFRNSIIRRWKICKLCGLLPVRKRGSDIVVLWICRGIKNETTGELITN